jgi:hypothetical protein
LPQGGPGAAERRRGWRAHHSDARGQDRRHRPAGRRFVQHAARRVRHRHTIKAAWTILKKKADDEKFAEAERERLRRATEYAAQAQGARDAERARLWASCSVIAESPVLLKGMEEMAREAGVVNEVANVRGLYLACNSRFLEGEAVCVLRIGVSASGKNSVVDQVLKFIPGDAVVKISGSSPKMLPYHGGNDPDALKHKIVYIPEAVMLAKKPGEADNEFTTMFRTLISEGAVFYQTVVIHPDGTRDTETYIKNGPIVAILTTAKEVEVEMKTRCLTQDTDETGKQTSAIVKRRLSKKKHRGSLNYQRWIDFQQWLALDAPYQVDVPFSEAIGQAFDRWRPSFLENAPIRMRRDVNSFLTVIKASAVVYKAQRQKDEDGYIVATLDDYQNAYDAFDAGLAATHGGADENVIAVVEAIEDIAGDSELSVKVTLRELAKRLRIGSLKTAGARLMSAVTCEAVEQDDSRGGPGGARYFRVLKTADALRAGPGSGVFPPPDIVREIYFGEGKGGTKETKEQTAQSDAKRRI